MKIVYHINSIYNPGGMERVTLNKVSWLTARGHQVIVVTTDQKGRPAFFPLPDGVRTVDLGIDYSDDVGSGILRQTLSYLKKRRIHRKRLAEFLMSEKADIVVSLYPGESSFIPDIKDGSRKVLELHQNRFFHRQYANKGLKGIADRLREWSDLRMVRRFDSFVVLTEEDRGYWGALPNISVIPNAVVRHGDALSDCTVRRVLAVGRLDYQKGFDRLVEAWALAAGEGWTLDIYGQGEWKTLLQGKIDELGISASCRLMGTSSDMEGEYVRASLLVMSSHYEGFPMVMVEAMSCGLPVVSFDFRTGPRDIVTDGVDGLLVPDGDIRALAAALRRVMDDDELRVRMGASAVKVAGRYSEEAVMGRWMSLFEDLMRR